MINLDKAIVGEFLSNFDSGFWEYRDGRVYRNKRNLNQFKTVNLEIPEVASFVNSQGYRRVAMKKRTMAEHRLIFALHHGVEELYKHECIDHIDGDKQNNCISNLRGLSVRENTSEAERIGNFKRTYGEINGMTKLTPAQVSEIREMYGTGPSQYDLAARFKVSQGYISRLVRGEMRIYG